MHRWTAVVALAVVFLATAPGAAACLPYTFDDADWGLERSELTNYQVAVWRLDGDRVATTGDIRSPRVAGVTFTTLAALRAAIAGLPDTATQRASGISNLAALVAGFALLGLGLALAGSRLGIGRRRG